MYLETLDRKKRQQEILKEEYRNGEWYANDIRAVDTGCLPRADCWCFGFPCQDISCAGRQLGFNGYRSSLFFAVTKLVKDLREGDKPKFLFVENVKNLLSVNRGFDFARLLTELDEIGYDAEWAVLNSKDHGVPQNRERVFIIAHLRERGTKEVFPLRQAAGEALAGQPDGSRGELVKAEEGFMMPSFAARQNGVLKSQEIAGCLDANYYKGLGCNQPRTGVIVAGNVNPSSKGMNGNVFDAEGLAPALTTKKGEGSKIAIPILSPEKGETRQNGRRFKENGEPMFTLTVQDRHGVILFDDTMGYNGTRVYEETCPTLRSNRCGLKVSVLDSNQESVSPIIRGGLQEHQSPRTDGISLTLTGAMGMGGGQTPVFPSGFRIRRLTLRECFRLQAWADCYYNRAAFVNSDNQLYKQAGNGVTVSVIEAIAKKLD